MAAEAERLLADEDLVRLRSLLQPRGDVDRVSGHQSLLRARDHLARVEADPQRQPRSVIAFQLLIQFPERLPHLRRSTHRPQGVVLVQNGDAEHRHHRIADELFHRPLMALDHLSHYLEIARHHPTQRLRVEPLP